MKTKYRIRQYCCGLKNSNGEPLLTYVIEQKLFGLFWCRLNDFNPVTIWRVFNTIEDAEKTLKRYIAYKEHLKNNGKVVKIIDL